MQRGARRNGQADGAARQVEAAPPKSRVATCSRRRKGPWNRPGATLAGAWAPSSDTDAPLLEGREQQLGALHPDTLLFVCDLAELRKTQGMLMAEAEPLFRRALEVRERQLPPRTRSCRSTTWRCCSRRKAEPLRRSRHHSSSHNLWLLRHAAARAQEVLQVQGRLLSLQRRVHEARARGRGTSPTAS